MNDRSQPQSRNRAHPKPLPLSVQVWGATDTGRQREGNEDSVYPESGAEFFKPTQKRVARKGQLLLVADGMGGTQAGSEASRWATRVFVERYYDMPEGASAAQLKAVLEVANNSLFQYLQSTGVREAGCTLAAALIHRGVLHVANVGDSRVYLLRAGRITQLTRDHTVTQQKIDQGLISAQQAESDPDRNVITRSLGLKPQVQVDLFPPMQLLSGDVVLLCSDGLSDMLSDAQILNLMGAGTLKQAAKRLIAAANKMGGQDNISLVLAQVGSQAVPSGSAAQGLTRSAALEHIFGLPFKQGLLLGGALLIFLFIFVVIGWWAAGWLFAPAPTPDITLLPPTAAEGSPTATLTPDVFESERGKATSTPIPTPIPTLPPPPRAPVVTPAVTPGSRAEVEILLLTPAQGLAYKNPVAFSWQGPLGEGQQYRLVLVHTESGHVESYVLSALGKSVDLPREYYGAWSWWLEVLVQEQVLGRSAVGEFWFTPLDVPDSPGPVEPSPTPTLSRSP